MFTINENDVRAYVKMPDIFCQGMSDNILVFMADNGNHFTHYGIYGGMYLFFDLEKEAKKGHLSCYKNNLYDDRPPYKVSDAPLENYTHIGRLTMALRNYEVSDNGEN